MKTKQLLYSLFTLLLMSSCITNTEDLTDDELPVPEEISYAENIQPIFNQSCGGSGCHINNSRNGVNLSSYSATMNSIGSNYGTAIVLPGDPANSPLVDKIEPSPDIGNRMPLSGSPLTNNEISRIRKWITDGAPNN